MPKENPDYPLQPRVLNLKSIKEAEENESNNSSSLRELVDPSLHYPLNSDLEQIDLDNYEKPESDVTSVQYEKA